MFYISFSDVPHTRVESCNKCLHRGKRVVTGWLQDVTPTDVTPNDLEGGRVASARPKVESSAPTKFSNVLKGQTA